LEVGQRVFESGTEYPVYSSGIEAELGEVDLQVGDVVAT
jgi:hypothetical protein